MAFIEIQDDKPASSGVERTFFKFNAIGDKVMGYFIGKVKKTSTFPDGQVKDVTEWTFRTKEGVDQIVSGTTDMNRKLEKAEKDGHLKPGVATIVEFKSTLPTGKATPMKVFRVACDPSIVKIPTPKPYVPAGAAAADDNAPF